MKYSKISDYKIKIILKKFCLELTATQAAKDIGINRHTIDSYYNLFRQKIVEYQGKQEIKLDGQIEIDESYFGSRHFGDPRGRSTQVKIPVIGLLKRNGVVYTQIISDASRSSIMPIIAN